MADVAPARFAALIAPAIDRTFVAGMTVPRERGSREVVARHGGADVVGGLVEFRTSLACPGRVISVEQWRAVWRYRDPADGQRWIDERVSSGVLEAVLDGFRATAAGLAFLADLHTHQQGVLDELWGSRAEPLVDPLGHAFDIAAAGGGPAFAAMTPAYEPAATTAAMKVLDLLSGLRFYRSDAHAEAWADAGLTAAGIAALGPGPRRDAVEAETNRLAAAPWTALTPDDRLRLLADLAALPG